jgi:Ca2+/Na+ antiporter
VFGFPAPVPSSYVLSYAASNLVDEFGISDVLFGIVILSIATTIPEKFVSVISGFRGQAGIIVANTVGSNIFLLSLCMGVLWVSTGGAFDQGSVNATELGGDVRHYCGHDGDRLVWSKVDSLQACVP